MRLPSAEHLFRELIRVLRRFPFTLAWALVAGAGGVLLVDANRLDDLAVRLWTMGSLGIPLSLALDLALRHRDPRKATRGVAQVVAAGLLLGFLWGWTRWPEPICWRRFFQFLLAAHLLVAVLPWVDTRRTQGFWQYNRLLFQRFLVSTVFAGVLYAGLSVAVLAVDQLFGADVSGEFYARLFFVVFYVFHPVYFLGGIPNRLESLEEETAYPLGLKVFAQYILLPLVSVYLMILLLYLGKVLVTREWPSGWIGYLVSSVAVAGVLSLLLLVPAESRPGGTWIRTYRRLFYLCMLPALAMLLVAVGKRIEQYGVTENRYFLAVLAVWMAGVSLWFLLRRHARIEIIPASLALIALLTSFGPWGAYVTSKRSQLHRLESTLQRLDLIRDGRLAPATAEVSLRDRKEIGATLTYLYGTHGDRPMRDWLGPAWSRVEADSADTDPRPIRDARRMAHRTMKELDLAWAEPQSGARKGFFNYWSGDHGTVVDLTDYDQAFRARTPLVRPSGESGEYFLIAESEGRELVLRREREELLRLDVGVLVSEIRSLESVGPHGSGEMPQPFRWHHVDSRLRMLLVVYSLSGREEEGRILLQNLDADVFLSILDSDSD